MDKLKQTFGIETNCYYSALTNKHDTLSQQSLFSKASLPFAGLVNSRLFNLPIYPTLSLYEQNLIIEAIHEVAK